jgi:hypothetical protein
MSYNFAHQAPSAQETDWRGLSRMRPGLHLGAEARFGGSWRLFVSGRGNYDLAYSIRGRADFSRQVLDRYESELELWDTYLAGRLGPSLDVKIGRQIVAWGNSETVRVTDVLNPLDLREPGITDLEDLRLPVAMTRVDLQAGSWSLTGIAIHERRFDKTPAFGHDFFPSEYPPPAQSMPANTLANTELAAAAHGHFQGWDLSLYGARVFDDNPRLELGAGGRPELRHARLEMLGASWDLARGDCLLKAEAAHFRGLEPSSPPGSSLSRTELLAGIEHSGMVDTSLTFEAVWRHLHGFSRRPDGTAQSWTRQDELDWVVRMSRTFLHQTLTVTLVAVTLGATGEGGALQRLEGRYDLTDSVEITGGVVLYQSGDRPGFGTVGDNDRFFLEVEHRF